MKILLICHKGADLTRIGIARWLCSFSDLVGIIILQETKKRVLRRFRREIKRVGIFRFILEVVTFRIYYNLFLSKKDKIWQKQKLKELCNVYPEIPEDVPILYTQSPNSTRSEKFITKHRPDFIVARCKTLLKEKIFSIPSKGTVVMHPGICPEYRNAHGCFWALANNDLDKVGMTLLRINKGVDTGPVYGYYSYDYDEVNESHMVIQNRVVLENLDSIREKLIEMYKGEAVPIDTSDKQSRMWGQPWLTRYLRWKLNARRRSK